MQAVLPDLHKQLRPQNGSPRKQGGHVTGLSNLRKVGHATLVPKGAALRPTEVPCSRRESGSDFHFQKSGVLETESQLFRPSSGDISFLMSLKCFSVVQMVQVVVIVPRLQFPSRLNSIAKRHLSCQRRREMCHWRSDTGTSRVIHSPVTTLIKYLTKKG